MLGNFTGAVRPGVVMILQSDAMEILTDQPGIQFYSETFSTTDLAGNSAARSDTGGAVAPSKRSIFPMRPTIRSSVDLLRPGETYTQTCIYRFCVCPENNGLHMQLKRGALRSSFIKQTAGFKPQNEKYRESLICRNLRFLSR